MIRVSETADQPCIWLVAQQGKTRGPRWNPGSPPKPLRGFNRAQAVNRGYWMAVESSQIPRQDAAPALQVSASEYQQGQPFMHHRSRKTNVRTGPGNPPFFPGLTKQKPKKKNYLCRDAPHLLPLMAKWECVDLAWPGRSPCGQTTSIRLA